MPSKHPTTPTTQRDGDQNHETVIVSVHVMVAVDVFDVESTTIAIPEWAISNQWEAT